MLYKVMIVEDEDAIRKGLIYGFEWYGVNSVVVADTFSATEAISLIEDHQPDILITDINLPIMNGLELISKTRDNHNFVTIIISGYADFNYAQEAIELGVVRFLSKPIDENELQKAMLAAIEQLKYEQVVSMNEKQVSTNDIEFEEFMNTLYKKRFEDSLVHDILEFVDNNYYKKITLNDVSKLLNYSESTINNRLNSVIGTTFIQYLNQVRIHKAVQILKTKDYANLQDVSYKVGISDYQHFSNLFKKYTNFTPKEFAVKVL